MTNRRFIAACGSVIIGASAIAVGGAQSTAVTPSQSRQLVFRNADGLVRTITTKRVIDLSNPFFQPLGTNGRSCSTCHAPEEGWSITPQGVQSRFAADPTDPIFRNNDGSNCEGDLPVSRQEQWDAYSLLLTRGLVRVGLDVPAGSEFVIDAVADPYGCGSSSNDVSVYRRPLPSTNLRFLTAVMWDGRESSVESAIVDDLSHQANAATRGHAAAFADISADQARQIVEFESALYTAQSYNVAAGDLTADGARGGPVRLSNQPFFLGINDPVGLNPTGAPFTPVVFDIFDSWGESPQFLRGPVVGARQAILRGQAVFNTRTFTVSGVSGLNAETFSNGVTAPSSFTGTCTVCHDSPNVGNHSVKAPLDIGLTAPAIAADLPVYTLRNLTTGDTVQTTDPGRALITGKWRDLNRFKGPVLRGLAARAPYFHNGTAATLRDVVDFYDKRFNIGFTEAEVSDLVAFLRSL
jgi:cytochrome c peroxidase